MFKILSNIYKVRFSFVSARVFILSMFLLVSGFAEAQLTAQDHNGGSGYNTDHPTVTPCGTNIYKVKFYQANAWQQGKINIKWNGTKIGHTTANGHLGYTTNQQTDAANGGFYAMAGHAGRWWYINVNTSAQTAYGYTSDFSCATAPTVTTSAASVISCNSATLGGNLTDGGTQSVTARGFIYGTNQSDVNNSTIASLSGSSTLATASGTSTGTYTKAISSLSSGTTYYVRAYATNSVGTGYGSAVTFVANITVATSSGGSRNYADGAGSVNLTASTSTGSGNIKWYTTLVGGTAEATTSTGATWATPSISATTVYYAEAVDGSCTSSPRTAVTAEVKVNPGGVSSNLHAWWKADAGTNTSTDDAIVSTWTDQSDNAWAANKGGNGADYWENGINFNPMLKFPGNNANHFKVTGGIYEGGQKASMFTYVVFNRHDGDHNMLYGQAHSSGLFGFGLYGNGYAYSYEGANNANGNTNAAWGGNYNQTYLWSTGSAQNTSTPQAGYRKYITRDNNIVSRTNGVDQRSGGTNPFYIGYWGGWQLDGDMAELIIYDGTPTATEEDKIQSYLSVKYGITLASMNYLSSDGTTIWDNAANSAYQYDIAGIGHDAGSGLLQKQSKSVNSDAIVTMSSEAIAVNNAANGTSLDNGEFLLWGNDNASLSTINNSELPTGYFARINREWLVEMTGTVSNVHVEIDISDFGFLIGDEASDYYLLKDGDGNFASGATGIAGSTLADNKVTFNDVNFSDGDRFTLATKQPSPGGNYEKVLLWLRADAGTNTTTDGQRVTSWKSQAIGGTGTPFTAVENGATGPTYLEDGINGYPALDFSSSQLYIPSGIAKNKNTLSAEDKHHNFTYIVAQTHTISGNNNLVRQLGHNSNFHHMFRHNSTTQSADFYHGKYPTTNGRIVTNGDVVLNQTHLWSLGGTTGDASTTPHDKKRYIYRDGQMEAENNNSNSAYLRGSNNYWIGCYNSNHYYDGLIAEIIVLDEAPTDAEDRKILSYLNNKYGLSTASTDNFINSDGTSTWIYNSAYNTMIAGIRRDDITSANRKQSKANNTNAKMTISTQAIAATNAANTTQIATDKSALVWAQKNGVTRAVSTDASGLTGTFTQRLSSEWLVKETGTVGNVLVEVDLGGLTFDNESANKFGLVVDDDGDFTGGDQTLFIADNFSVDKKLTFNSVSLTGSKYVAIMNGTVAALPVELLYFEGKRIGSNVLLEWETMAEINNDYFIVEKSTDGTNWDELLTVNGQGNTSEQTYYSQIDIDGCNGTCYYRLTQVDFDGNSEKFKVVAVSVNEAYNKLEISVSPNPINQTANIAFTAPESGMFSLTVTTQTGQVMYTANTMGDKGNNHISYNAAMLSSGSYYFILEDENGNRTQQLVIK